MSDVIDAAARNRADKIQTEIQSNPIEFALLYLPYCNDFFLADEFDLVVQNVRDIGELDEIIEIMEFVLNRESYLYFESYYHLNTTTAESVEYIYTKARNVVLESIKAIRNTFDYSSKKISKEFNLFRFQINTLYSEHVMDEG